MLGSTLSLTWISSERKDRRWIQRTCSWAAFEIALLLLLSTQQTLSERTGILCLLVLGANGVSIVG